MSSPFNEQSQVTKSLHARKRKKSIKDSPIIQKTFVTGKLNLNGNVDVKDNESELICNDHADSKDADVITRCECLGIISSSNKRLSRFDFSKSSINLAKYLLGKCLVHVVNGNMLIGRIVETEAYLGVTDKACHTYGGKQTERTKPMYMVEGTSYVYSIYGMYFCLNISSNDNGGCVLLRALEPITGMEIMVNHRNEKRKQTIRKLKNYQLCNGPSKLCQAMKIDKTLNTVDMTSSNNFYVEDDKTVFSDDIVIECKRIGIDGYGEPAASQPYRFYIRGNKNVSIVNKTAENSTT